MLYSWLGLLLACGCMERWCKYTTYDLRASDAACTLHKHGNSCLEQSWTPLCLKAPTIKMLSPRALSNVAGMGGPLLTWLPLLAGAGSPSAAGATRSTLARTAIWYLACIGLIRHTHILLEFAWDPSGHVIVYGSQLIPVWHLYHAGAGAGWQRPLVGWLLCWGAVLLWLSAMTANFFHTLSETAAAGLMVLGLASWLDADDATARGLLGTVWYAAAASWLAFTAVGWLWSASSAEVLGGELAYDAVVWLLLRWLLRADGEYSGASL